MKHAVKITLFMLLTLLFLMGCESQELTKPQSEIELDNPANLQPEIKGSLPTGQGLQPLWAGRNIQAGNLYLANDAQNLYITYFLEEGWQLMESNLHVSRNVENIPADPKGAPLPEMFAYQVSMQRGTKVYTHTIPLAEIGASLGDDVYVASRASLVRVDDKNQSYPVETAWAGEIPGSGPEWWQFSQYRLSRNLIGIDNIGRMKDMFLRGELAME